MKSKQIATLLRKALLKEGKMEYALYEFELEEHIDYWHEGLKADRNDFVFAVTEHSGDVAMLLILSDKTVFVNEDARAKLSELWPKSYISNIKRLIPIMAQQLANDIIAVNGITTADPKTIEQLKQRKRVWVKARE